MTGPEEPPRAQDAGELTPEEWEAVRRLRARSADARPAEDAAPVAEPVQTAEPAPVQPADTPEPSFTTDPSFTAAEPVEEPAAPAAPAERRTAGRAAALPAIVFLVVLAVVAAVLAVLTTLKVSDRHAETQAGTQAVAAAASGVATVLSYNYKSLDNDFAKAETLLTPQFRDTYRATTAKAVQPLAAKYKAVSTAQVTAAGVVSATASKASVLVFVSQQVTNTQLAAPRLDRSRIVVDLVHQHGRWLIAKLNPV